MGQADAAPEGGGELLFPSALARYRALMLDLGLLLLRVGAGALMLFGHGLSKLSKLGDTPVQFADPIGLGATPSLLLAVSAEVGAAALLILGLGTRLAAAPLLFTMLVAAFIVHGDDPFKRQELSILYGLMYLALLLTGGGRFSLDHTIATWRTKTSS